MSKKQKRSFLDDDFFVMKKPGRKSPTSSSPRKPKAESPGVEGDLDSRIPKDPPSSDGYLSASDSFGTPVPLPAETTGETARAVVGAKVEASAQAGVKVEAVTKTEPGTDSGTTPGTKAETKLETKADTPSETSSKPPCPGAVTEVESEDDLDTDLQQFFTKIPHGTETDSNRIYTVTVTSKLGPGGVHVKQISGNTTFGQLVQLLERDTLRTRHQQSHWQSGSLVWVEGRSELKPFFKPSTLRIPEPEDGSPSRISCLYIPSEHLADFERLYSEFHEQEAVTANTSIVEIGDSSDSEAGREPSESRNSGYFVIGLKGKDNKRIEAEVGPTTKIRSLLKYYLQVKGLKDSGNCRLVFDDEELDLDAEVRDTELEEDFEVQVYI